MKRTIALALSLLLLLTLVPTTALADVDVHPRLEVTLAPTTKTLFQYGTGAGSDPVLNWQNADLVVKLFDDTAANAAGTTLELASAISTGKYVIMIGTTTYNPTVGSQYAFTMADIGSKTLTIKYTYKPTGQTSNVTVTSDVTISVQRNILSSIEVTAPVQTEYYVGEYINLTGAVVKAKYTNTETDASVTLTSSDYTVTSTKTGGTDPISVSQPLTTDYTNIRFGRTETYAGSETEVYKYDDVAITVAAAASALTLKEGATEITAPLSMVAGSATRTITADVGTGPKASLVANVSNPAVAAINTEALTGSGTFTITPLSIGTAVVTVRTRGSNITKTIAIEVTKAPTPAIAVVLDKATISLPVNSPFALLATISPDDTTDKTLTWTSSSPSNVSVDSTGSVKVLRDFSTDAADGTAIKAVSGVNYVTITVTTVNGKTATCLVSVNTILVDGIAISDTSITLNKGSWKKLSAVTTPTNAANPAVTWSSSNTGIATVDATGKVTANPTAVIPSDVGYVEAIITAQTSTASVYATCTVKVVAAVLITSLTLNKSELALNVGDEETLTVTGTPSNATNKTLVWTSSNPEVASVNSAGKVIGASKGTAIIRADSTDGSGKYVSCVVTVNNIQILNVYMDKSSLDLSEGDTASIVATIYPSNATTKTLKWTSSNTSVATVDSKGNVIAGATKGYTIITAAATDGSGKFAECVVLSKPKIYVTGLTINYGTSLDLLAGDSTYLKATILPANASDQTVTWASSNTAYATVDASTGLLKGLALGEATITATAGGKSVAIKINVTNTEYNYGVAANFNRRVNVRASASGLSKLVGYAYLGDTFKILGKTGSWYLIQYNNTTKAYIWSAYLKATKTSAAYVSANGTTTTTPAPGTTATPTTTTPTKVTIANCLYAVNVRASASTTSTRVGKANLGATFPYLGKEGDWYKIQYNTTTVAYVYGTFVTLS